MMVTTKTIQSWAYIPFVQEKKVDHSLFIGQCATGLLGLHHFTNINHAAQVLGDPRQFPELVELYQALQNCQSVYFFGCSSADKVQRAQEFVQGGHSYPYYQYAVQAFNNIQFMD